MKSKGLYNILWGGEKKRMTKQIYTTKNKVRRASRSQSGNLIIPVPAIIRDLTGMTHGDTVTWHVDDEKNIKLNISKSRL